MIREIERRDYTFSLPLRAIFAGSSQVGKTHLITQILKNQKNLFNTHFTKVYYFYPELLSTCPLAIDFDCEIVSIAGFPDMAQINKFEPGSIVIIDDQSEKLVKSEDIAVLYKVLSGKRSISVISVVQNYFLQGKFSQTIKNCSNYVALFRNCSRWG